MKKILGIIAFAVLIPVMTAQAEGNANEVQRLLNSQVGSPVFPQPNALTQPSRRDVAGAVELKLEPTDIVAEDEVKLNSE